MQCLMRELKSISRDRWLDDPKVDCPEIRTYGDVADR
jgi:hypothetical protein